MSNILLVEDSPTQARFVGGALESTEYELHTVGTLAEAIQVAQLQAFDAIILDLALPDSDGLDTYQRMQDASSTTPIVVLTSTADEQFALGILRSGAQDYLIKGEVTSEWIVRSIRYAMERSNAVRMVRAGAGPTTPERGLQIEQEQVADIVVLRLNERQLSEEEFVDELSSHLFKLVDEGGHLKFVLNLRKVDYISNSVLSKLLLWDQTIRQHAGSMRICELRPEVQAQIRARKLLAQFDIFLDESTALSGF